MTQKQFEKELAEKLAAVPGSERQKVLDYYRELYAEKAEHGLGEREIIASFGDPSVIAQEVLGESVFNKNVKRVKQRARSIFTNKYFWVAYCAGFMITIPLTIVLFSIIFGLAIGAFAAVFAVVVSAIAFIAAGPVFAGYGVYMMFDSVNAGLAQLGAAIALLAIGLILLMLLKVLDFLRIALFVRRVNWNTAFARATRHKKWYAVLAIVCICILSLGGGLFALGLGKAGWDIRKLDTVEYTSVTQEINEPVSKVDINVLSRNVHFVVAEDNWRVEAYNYLNNIVTITFEDGVLTVRERTRASHQDVLNMFSAIDSRKRNIYVYLPANIDEIGVDVTAGNVSIRGFTANDFAIKATSGNIDIRNSAADTMTIKAISGNVNILTCTVTDLDVRATSGNIIVRLVGTKAEYNITVSTVSGNRNVSNQTVAGDKKVRLHATSGNINLGFVAG